jgi:hypothetical protein
MEVGNLAFLLWRIAEWPSFLTVDGFLSKFIRENYFRSVSNSSHFFLRVHARGCDLEAVFGINAGDIISWAREQSAETLGEAIAVLIKLFQNMTVMSNTELIESFLQWADEILPLAAFPAKRMLAFAMVVLGLKSKEIGEELVLRRLTFLENIETQLSDEEAACAAMELFLLVFEQSPEIAAHPAVASLTLAWQDRSVSQSREKTFQTFLQTFRPNHDSVSVEKLVFG